MKKNDINAISQHLAEVESQTLRKKNEIRAELNQARAELDELESQRTDAETVAEYKRLSDLIHDKREYIDFLRHKERSQQGQPIDGNELKSLQAALLEEVRQLEKETAPEIYKPLMEIIRAYEIYAQRVDELDEVYNHARRLAGLGSCPLDARLEEMQTDRYDWYYTFVLMCNKHHREIAAAKKASGKIANMTPWNEYVMKLKKYAD